MAIPMGVQPVPQSTIPVSSVTPPCLGALGIWVWVFVSASYVITMDAAFSVYLSFLLVRVALTLRSLRIHIPRLCRFELFNTTQRSLFNQRRVLLAPPAPKPAAMRQR